MNLCDLKFQIETWSRPTNKPYKNSIIMGTLKFMKRPPTGWVAPALTYNLR